MNQPLQGKVVIDFTQNVAGPYCTQILGDLGARVIKIERPYAGDDTRGWFPPQWNGESTTFLALNRNKESVCLDLHHPESPQIIRKLLERADIVVQSFRTSTARKLGLDFASLRHLYPNLVYVEVSAYGVGGPNENLPGYDAILQAYTGIMSVNGDPKCDPARVGVSIIDLATGMWAAMGALAVVLDKRTDTSRYVQASLLETGVAWMQLLITNYLAEGSVPAKMGSVAPMAAPYEAFRTHDGWIMIAAGNNTLFRKLCTALDSQLDNNAKFASNDLRVMHRSELHEEIQGLLFHEQRTTSYWVDRLQAVGVPCSPIHSVAEVCRDVQVNSLELIKSSRDFRIPGFQWVDLPIRIDGQRADVRHWPPQLSEHTTAVLGWLGYPPDEINRLKQKRVVN
ncbi:MAG: formyl-CoA transferase [Sulfobacillus acidophilus]|uniref:Formyl-CoA transferase n=1 Tax=Sulfobacillus acidophilus TaxID=53633 RepID=A0A2T2WNC5_9FIRM|nr:MAG: formyl-CoA transferase [Sulfobacillus acidophilus]